MPDSSADFIPPYQIGSEWYDPSGLPMPPPPDLSSAAITITGPSAGQTAAAGSSIHLTFSPSPETTIASILANAADSNGIVAMSSAWITNDAPDSNGVEALGMSGLIGKAFLTVTEVDSDENLIEKLVSYAALSMAVSEGNLVATLTIPPTTLGTVNIGAMAVDTMGNTALLETSVWVQTAAAVEVLTVSLLNDNAAFSGVGQTTQLSLTAAYSDGVLRDVTAAGTSYVSANPLAATVSSTGLITAVGAGTTQITCTNGEAICAVPITVHLQAPSIFSVNPLGAGAGQTFLLRVDGTNFGGLTNIQFLTPAGMPDPNITVSRLSLSPDTYSFTAAVTIASHCPPGVDTIVVTAAGGSSDPRPSGANKFTILASGTQ